MKFAPRILLACLIASFGAVAVAGTARADDAPQVNPDTALVVLNAFGTGFANLREAPDPRSEAVLKMPAGLVDLHPTGAVKTYGDTWWLEVKSGTVTGWLNARLAGYAPAGTPLQTFINIDSLQPVADYAFAGSAYTEGNASFEECARRCAGDSKCLAVEFSATPPLCRQFDQRPDITKQTGTQIAAKAAPTPAGGWGAQIQKRFERLPEQGIDGKSNRDRIAHSADECAAECSFGQSCSAYAYQRKGLVCSLFKQGVKAIARSGSEAGLLHSVAPMAADVLPPPATPKVLAAEAAVAPKLAPLPKAAAATPAVPAKLVGSKARPLPPRDTELIEPQFKKLLEDASRTAAYAAPEIGRNGRVRIKPRVAALAEGGPEMGLGLSSSALAVDGDINNLAPLLDAAKPTLLHLVFYAQPAAAPLVIATASYDTAEDASAAALKMQKDLDEIARNAGLSADPMALLKPLRR